MADSSSIKSFQTINDRLIVRTYHTPHFNVLDSNEWKASNPHSNALLTYCNDQMYGTLLLNYTDKDICQLFVLSSAFSTVCTYAIYYI